MAHRETSNLTRGTEDGDVPVSFYKVDVCATRGIRSHSRVCILTKILHGWGGDEVDGQVSSWRHSTRALGGGAPPGSGPAPDRQHPQWGLGAAHLQVLSADTRGAGDGPGPLPDAPRTPPPGTPQTPTGQALSSLPARPPGGETEAWTCPGLHLLSPEAPPPRAAGSRE